MDHNISLVFKNIMASACGWFAATLSPAVPFCSVCTVMVIIDVISARRLARRLSNKYPEKGQRLKFSSARFSKAISTLIRIYGALLLAAMIQSVILGESFELLKFTAGIVCFWQAVSILENEASCNPNPWARILRNVLIDKTERHLGINLEELRNMGDDESESEIES